MKRLIIICLALIWLIPSTAMAHSKLETSIPAQGDTVNASPEHIEMTFDTKIEKLSNFKLFNAAGEQIESERATVEGDTMTGAIAAPLENGEYTVHWTIIGADGHAVEGKYTFTVDAPELETPIEEEPTDTPTEAPTESSNEQPSATAEPTPQEPDQSAADSTNMDNSSAEKDKEGFNSTPIVILIGIIIIAATIILLIRRRK